MPGSMDNRVRASHFAEFLRNSLKRPKRKVSPILPRVVIDEEHHKKLRKDLTAFVQELEKIALDKAHPDRHFAIRTLAALVVKTQRTEHDLGVVHEG